MIPRAAHPEILSLARQFKAVAIVGPRQSGKTTLAKAIFPNKAYVNFENPDIRLFATEDPRGFLSNYKEGAIFDEAQRVPDLFSYLQQILDESTTKGLFIITGSNNFLLQERISQSLAGRVGYLHLLPLALSEMQPSLRGDLNTILLKGGYPSLHAEAIHINQWYTNYIRTYVERDVRLIKNISSLHLFERFLRLCAGRVGQLFNASSLAIEVGVDAKTIQSWLGILETSFVAFRLQPYHNSFNKRLVKMPKLYFYDTGLLAALLNIEHVKQLDTHMYRGNLFENLVVLEVIKSRYNQANLNPLYFWRASNGQEIDLLIEKYNQRIPVEIKAGQTVTPDYFKGIRYWRSLTQATDHEKAYVVYAGAEAQSRSANIKVLPYSELDELTKKEDQQSIF